MPLLKVPEVLLELKDLFNRMKTMKRSIVTRKSEEKRKAEDIDIRDFLYQYRGFVYANAIKILKDTDQAEDCVQIAFERVLRNIEKILALNEAQICSYLYKTVRSCAVDILRKERRCVPMEREDLEIIINRQRTDEILGGCDWSDRFEEIFLKLRGDEVSMLISRYQDHMTYAQIAEELGLSEDACKKRGQRLKRKIANLLSQEKGGTSDE